MKNLQLTAYQNTVHVNITCCMLKVLLESGEFKRAAKIRIILIYYKKDMFWLLNNLKCRCFF